MTTKTIKINEREITVKSLLVEDLPAFLNAVEPFLKAFDDMVSKNKGSVEDTDLLQLCLKFSPDIVNLCVVMTDADRDFIAKLEPLQFFNLATNVIEMSQDFFLIQIAEPIAKISEKLLSVARQRILTTIDIGLNLPSNNSSMADTSSPTL